ncbi:hypothetical protein B0H14DRAFT_3437375 [Mycena olivaceomarginata]|nr:hypothetical protein B0H14DRAFT_3437375 [Mycena olivaceomarginata]
MLALALSLVVHTLVFFYFFIAPVSARRSAANTLYPPFPALPYHPSPEDADPEAVADTRGAKRKQAEGTDEDEDEEDTPVSSRRSSRPHKRALLHISVTDDEAEDSDSALPETLPLPWVTPIARTRPRSGRPKAVLQPVKNQPKAQRRAPSPLKKVVEVAQSYRPQYKPRVRRFVFLFFFAPHISLLTILLLQAFVLLIVSIFEESGILVNVLSIVLRLVRLGKAEVRVGEAIAGGASAAGAGMPPG